MSLHRNICIEEEQLCYNNVNTLIQKTSSLEPTLTLELFLSSIKLFLTVLDKLSWRAKEEHIHKLTSDVKCWIEHLHGDEPNEQVIEVELKVCQI